MGFPANMADPSFDFEVVTPADTDFANGACRTICSSADTIATIKRPNGSVVTGYPLQKGYNPIGAIRVVSVTGTPVIAILR